MDEHVPGGPRLISEDELRLALPKGAEILTGPVGMKAFTVDVDDSPEFNAMLEEARKLKALPFAQKLEALKQLALGAMTNAYEGMVNGNQRDRGLVMTPHPLSDALEARSGCCRYQGALFFALAHAAELGDKHLLQAAPVSPGVNSVYNQVFDGEKMTTVSIFLESLKDKSLDYSVQNPRVFEEPFKRIPGFNFYSYYRTDDGQILLVRCPDSHLDLALL